MRIRLYPRPELLAWLLVTSVGTLVSLISGREVAMGMDSVRKVALNRPHAQDILRMAQQNLLAERLRTVGQSLFLLVGVLALFSRPPLVLGQRRIFDRVLPWVIVLVEAILVGNSVNEYILSQRVLKRRVAIQVRRGSEAK